MSAVGAGDLLRRLEELKARLAAEGSALRYPRYDGGFFVTLFAEDAKGSAERLKARGVFTVPGKDSLRVALCSVPEAQVPALVDALRDCVR
jgi:aromatic-amino-acid transaminase